MALPVWAHNPKLVYSPQDETWVMYHIGAGNDPGRAVNCTPGASQPERQQGHQQGQRRSAAAAGAARPFEIHYAKSLSGPWLALTAELGSASSVSTLFTAYPGVDNVGGVNVPDGSGKAFIPVCDTKWPLFQLKTGTKQRPVPIANHSKHTHSPVCSLTRTCLCVSFQINLCPVFRSTCAQFSDFSINALRGQFYALIKIL